MRKKQILPWALVILLAALQPGMTVSADETTIENTTSMEEVSESAASAEGEQAGTTPAEEKTPEQIAEEERAKLEAEKQASLESQADTNLLPGWPQGPAVYAHSAVVMDMKSGAILYAKKPDEQHYPASITKLLTTLVALENAELTDKVTFSQDSVDILNWDDAHIGMKPGEEISMEDALYAVLLASANEVSYAVAESTGINRMNGDYSTFIARMNERAKELGCTGSNWVNPNGLHDEQHYTTAHDMALIASEVYQKEQFRKIMDTLEYRIGVTNLTQEERVFQQNHKMLWSENAYYYEYCTGGKTGYTDQAMTTLVTMADNGEMELAAVILYDYGVDAYTDTRAMMDYVFQNFSKVPITKLEQPEEVAKYTSEDAYIVLPNGADTSQVKCEITEVKGEKGTAVFTIQGQNVGSTEVLLSDVYFQQQKDVQVSDSDNKNITAVTGEQAKEKRPVKKMVLIGASAAAVLASAIGGRIVYVRYQRNKRRKQRRRRVGRNCNEDH